MEMESIVLQELFVASEEIYLLMQAAYANHGIIGVDKRIGSDVYSVHVSANKLKAILPFFSVLHVYDDKSGTLPFRLSLKREGVEYFEWYTREHGLNIIANFNGEKEYTFNEEGDEFE